MKIALTIRVIAVLVLVAASTVAIVQTAPGLAPGEGQHRPHPRAETGMAAGGPALHNR
ncbi:MAG TPA: hypothetical protein VFT05_06780 [Burkholderiaceae bacterium]|nr:hypothetical protein [Burkholderiaceae bacterium]